MTDARKLIDRGRCPICVRQSSGACQPCREAILSSRGTDTEVAEVLGVTRQAVADARRVRRLPRGVELRERAQWTTTVRVTLGTAAELRRLSAARRMTVLAYLADLADRAPAPQLIGDHWFNPSTDSTTVRVTRATAAALRRLAAAHGITVIRYLADTVGA